MWGGGGGAPNVLIGEVALGVVHLSTFNFQLSTINYQQGERCPAEVRKCGAGVGVGVDGEVSFCAAQTLFQSHAFKQKKRQRDIAQNESGIA